LRIYVSLMRLLDSVVDYLYLVNVRDSCITSTARRSYYFYVSGSNYGHRYTDLSKDFNMAVYVLYYYVCDVIADQTPTPVSFSFFDKIRYWIVFLEDFNYLYSPKTI
jgi:hypothetical protein